MLPLRPRTLHQGYEYADCADAASISPSSMAEKIVIKMIGEGMAVLHCIDGSPRARLDVPQNAPERPVPF
jgi:hypothetical protein